MGNHAPLTDAQQALAMTAHHVATALANRYRREGRGLEYDDLYTAAMEGICHAAAVFDPCRGTPFPAFARNFAWRSILHAIRDEIRASTGVTGYQQTKRAPIMRAQAVLEELGMEPDDALIAEVLGIDEETVREYGSPVTVVELDEEVEETLVTHDVIPCLTDAIDPDVLWAAVDELPPHLFAAIRDVLIEERTDVDERTRAACEEALGLLRQRFIDDIPAG